MYTSPSQQVFRGVVRVNCIKHGVVSERSAATGFFFEFPAIGGGIICLVTAAHVIQGFSEILFHIGERDSLDQLDISDPCEFRIPTEKAVYHPELDLCVIPFGYQINEYLRQGRRPWPFVWQPLGLPSQALLNQLRWIEELFMVGCPSGLYDEKNLIPIARRVTTATPLHIDYDGKPEFLIDGHIYKGSSGSPVMLINEGQILFPGGKAQLGGVRSALLGIVTETLLASDHTEIGLGRCVSASALRSFEALIPGCVFTD